MQKMKNGDRVEDKVTGFIGTVTAVTEWLTGSSRCEVTPKVKPSGEGDRVAVVRHGASHSIAVTWTA